jgi:hypothetical protein
MINRLLKISLATFIVVLISGCGGPKAISWNYELFCAGNPGASGVQMVKCFSYGSTMEKARKVVKRNAVHGYLFKGVAASRTAGSYCSEQPAICDVSYDAEQKWFDNFFDSGDYLQYVTLSNDGNVAASDRIKMKRGYKVGFTIAIKSDQLRKRMEKEGFARAMGGTFDN